MKWLKGKEDHPVPFLAVSPSWCCCCDFFFWLLMMGGFGCWETLQILVWGVLSCFGACVFCLCQNLFTLPETSTGTQKGIKPEVLVSVWWLVRACPWAPGCFETPTFFERSPVSDDEKHTNTIAKDAVVFEPTWKNIRLHFVAFYSVFFPKEWMLNLELRLSNEVNVPLNVDGKKQKLAICWGDRCVPTNNTETTINRAFGEFLNLQNSIYFQEVFFSTNAIGKTIVCFARLVAAALFPQKVHYENSMVSLEHEFVKVIQGISWILGVRLKVVGGFFCHIDHVVLFTELNVRCCGPWTSGPVSGILRANQCAFYMNCIFLLTSLSRFFSSTFPPGQSKWSQKRHFDIFQISRQDG